jgi:ADP-heptose:LPS heptosyltransferase
MRGLHARADVVDLEEGTPEFDFHCPVMSLPLAFDTRIETIPRAAYLSADDRKVADWERRLGRKARPRVGVVWRGSAIPDKSRSIPLERFRRLFTQHFEFVSLQKELTDIERAWLDHAEVLQHSDAIADFSDTAALCRSVDLVISIDTSVAHLADALGLPVWVLLPWLPDWRWLLDRDDSPWYPSMRLFRQETRGDWDGVLHRVGLELQNKRAAGTAGLQV